MNDMPTGAQAASLAEISIVNLRFATSGKQED